MATVGEHSSAGAEVFKLHFPSYKKVYDGNYLEHRELYNELKPSLDARPSFSVLDLGCGDAYYICKAVAELGKGHALAAYTGVDPSQPALDCAQANLRQLAGEGCELSWAATDMQTFLHECTCSYDFVLASFSMHHLNTREGKLEVLQEARRLLAPRGGQLLMVDVLREPTESVQEYRNRLCKDADENWVLMDKPGRDAIIAHMQKYDFPDTLASFEEMSAEAGFRTMRSIRGSKRGWCSLVIFET